MEGLRTSSLGVLQSSEKKKNNKKSRSRKCKKPGKNKPPPGHLTRARPKLAREQEEGEDMVSVLPYKADAQSHSSAKGRGEEAPAGGQGINTFRRVNIWAAP